MNRPGDRWDAGAAYEDFMGRWSRPVAERFVAWLEAEPGLAWLEIGCGTGALTTAVCGLTHPASVVACDPSEPFIAHTRSRIDDPRVTFAVAGADDPPTRESGFDRIVSGLVLNFVADPQHAVRAMLARLRPGGIASAYVWDYAGRMDFLRIFWEEAVALEAGAKAADERARFPICEPGALERVFQAAGARDVRVEAIDTPTRFRNFDDYWRPFLGGTGPAPARVLSLDESARERLRERLSARLAPSGGLPIDLIARARAVRGAN